MQRLGAVSFLNSKPLIAGLAERSDVDLHLDVPARLPALLEEGRVDAALIPIIDVIRSNGRLRVVSDACIACDGETLTVRVFSQVPPDRIRTLAADGDSHTSVALARLLWHQLYGTRLDVEEIDARRDSLAAHESVLLIGDKVVDPRRAKFAYQVDLGGAWRQHSGHPFVFAVWATRLEPGPQFDALAETLRTARDLGTGQARELARTFGPDLGWSEELAAHYLTESLRFTLAPRMVAGADLFAEGCGRYGLARPGARIIWPAECTPEAATR